MSDIRVITYPEHGEKRWLKPTNFSFTQKDRVVALGLSEIPKAMMSLPIAFIKNESYIPVAVLGFANGRNLLVTPSGQWVADYIPALYRCNPFKLAKNANGQFVLCADHESGLISNTAAGIQFFSDEKTISAETNAIATQLMQFESERARLHQTGQLLSRHNVIEPWPIQIQQDKEVQTVEGLYRINEHALNELPAEALAEIRSTGGLMICYAQLFSMQHLQQLGNVAQRTHWANRAAAGAVASLNITDDNGILSFANL